MAKFCKNCGKPLVEGKACDCTNPTRITINHKDALFPNEITPCDEETVIKTYHCAFLRTKFLMRTVAYGFLAITNKRVLYHTVPIKDDNTNFIHNEALIEDISGVSLSKGKFFFPGLFIANIFMIIFGLSIAVVGIPAMLSEMFSANIRTCLMICIVAYIGLIAFFFNKNRDRLKIMFPTVGSLIRFVADFLFGRRTALMFTVVSKGGASGPVSLSNLAILKQTGGWDVSAYPEPLENIHEITKEIGTIINDIQKTGGTSIA